MAIKRPVHGRSHGRGQEQTLAPHPWKKITLQMVPFLLMGALFLHVGGLFHHVGALVLLMGGLFGACPLSKFSSDAHGQFA